MLAKLFSNAHCLMIRFTSFKDAESGFEYMGLIGFLLKKIMYAIGIFCISYTVVAAQSEVRLSVDFNHGYQVIDNFGASDAWTFDPMIKQWMAKGQEQAIQDLAELLFSTDRGIGLSAWRFNIGAGSKEQGDASRIRLDNLGHDYRRAELMQTAPDAPINTNKQTGQIRFLYEALQYGVPDLIAFSNSPPVWATKNGLAHPDSTVGSTNLAPEMTDKFARFLLDVVTYLRQQHKIPINYISPINEPTWQWQGNTQEANRYNLQEVKAVYTALYQQLEQAELATQIAIEAGEVVEYTAALSDTFYQDFSRNEAVYAAGMNSEQGLGSYKNYIDALLGDADIRTKIGNKISLHGYFSEASSERMGRLRDLVWRNIQHTAPGAKVWMSELSILGGPDDVRQFDGVGWDTSDMNYALHVAKILHRDLSRLNASAWQWWLAVTPYDYKDGLLKVNAALEADSIQSSKVLWTLGQFSRFIRPDYQRIALTGADDLQGLMATAYKSADDQKIVIVAINASQNKQSVAIKLDNLPKRQQIQSFRVYLTDQQHDLQATTELPLSKPLLMPPRSIMTLVGDLQDSQTTNLN